MNTAWWSKGAGLVCLVDVSIAGAQPRIIDLGLPCGGTFAEVRAVSADGSAATGTCGSALFSRAFRLTPGGAVNVLDPLPGGLDCYANAISTDGSTVAGGSAISPFATRAVRWMAGSGPQDLGVLVGGDNSTALGASADGSAVAGWSETPAGFRAFLWTPAAGMVDLGVLPGGTSSSAHAISADGGVIAGTSGSASGDRAFRWTAAGMEDLGVLPGRDYSFGSAISADGLAVAGVSARNFAWPPTPETSPRSFRWTSAGMEDLGLLPGGTYAQARAISGDGLAVAGSADSSPQAGAMRAFLWTSALGLVDLNVHLPTLGVDLSGWTLTEAVGLNEDASAIVGLGLTSNGHRSWLVVLSQCYANCDASTIAPVLNVADFTCFLQRFAAGESDANCDGSTLPPVLNVQDFTCFLQRYAEGCR